MKKSLLSFDNVTFVLLCALMADCCVTGAGRVIMLGPISLRMLLFGATVLASVPLILSGWRELLRSKIVWAMGAWLVWLFAAAVIGLVNGNDRSLILTDLKGFAYFAVFPAAMCVLRDKERIHRLMRVMMYAAAVLCVVALAHLIICLVMPVGLSHLAAYGRENGLSGISLVTATMPRLFFKSSNYMIVGCAFPIYLQAATGKCRFHYNVITGTSLFCLLITYTRSVYLAVAVAAVVLVIAYLVFLPKAAKKLFWRNIAVSVAVFCVILAAFSIGARTNYFAYAIERTVLSLDAGPEQTAPADPDASTQPIQPTQPGEAKPTEPDETDRYQQITMNSDKLRGEITAELYKKIGRAPVTGNGLGAAIEWRDLNEYFYLDLMMKTGVVGLVLYFLPLLVMLVQTLLCPDEKREKKPLAFAWLCVLLGFMAFSYFNPYMNAALGVLFYCCTMGVVNTTAKAGCLPEGPNHDQ